jgi:hypothetical protein
MSLMKRTVAITVLSVVAIPVAALTIKNSSSDDVKVAVDNGSVEAVHTVPAGGSLNVPQDCSTGCAVTGPWSYSRLVNQNAVIDTDGTSRITVAPPVTPGMAALVPQNPTSELETGSTGANTAPPAAAEEEPAATPRKRRVKQAKKAEPGAGSLDMLFFGPKKK